MIVWSSVGRPPATWGDPRTRGPKSLPVSTYAAFPARCCCGRAAAQQRQASGFSRLVLGSGVMG